MDTFPHFQCLLVCQSVQSACLVFLASNFSLVSIRNKEKGTDLHTLSVGFYADIGKADLIPLLVEQFSLSFPSFLFFSLLPCFHRHYLPFTQRSVRVTKPGKVRCDSAASDRARNCHCARGDSTLALAPSDPRARILTAVRCERRLPPRRAHYASRNAHNAQMLGRRLNRCERVGEKERGRSSLGGVTASDDSLILV